jgi:hypothetical protein
MRSRKYGILYIESQNSRVWHDAWIPFFPNQNKLRGDRIVDVIK